MTWQEDLAAPFAANEIQFRPGSVIGPDKKQVQKFNNRYPEGCKAQRLPYIDARDAMNRLDKVIGPENWYDRYTIVDPVAHVVKCRLTIITADSLHVTKSDVGYPNSASDGDEKEPFKAAYSDAFKRAAVKWGVGRHLYDMPREWAPINQFGRFV